MLKIIRLCLIMCVIKFNCCYKLTYNFTYCESNNPMTILDMDFNCGDHDDMYSNILVSSNTSQVFDAIIMKKKREILNTKGTQCFAKKIIGLSYFNFFKSRESLVENVKLSEFDCNEMKISKKCFGNEMICEGDSCFYKPSAIYNDYSFLSTTRKETFECVMIERLILSYDIKTNIFNSFINSCRASDGVCFLHDSTIVWSVKSLNSCPYESLFYAYELNLIGNLAISNQEEILFRLDSTEALCNGNIIRHTTSGLGLVFVPPKINNKLEQKVEISPGFLLKKLGHHVNEKLREKSSKEKSKEKSVWQKVKLKSVAAGIEQLELVIAEEDYTKYEQNRQFVGVFNREERQMCNLFKNQIESYRAFDNIFFELNMLDSSILNIFVKDSLIYIPHCTKVEIIEILDETINCYEDIPIKMKFKDGESQNSSIQAYLTRNRFLKSVSTQIECSEANLGVSIPALKVKIEQKGNKYFVNKQDNIVQHTFHPNNINFTNFNFKHHIDNITNNNLIETFQEFNKVKEINGDFYVIPSSSFQEESEAKLMIKSLMEYKDNYKGLFWSVLIVLMIIILSLLEKTTGIISFFYTIIKDLVEMCGICCKTGRACCQNDIV